MDDYLSKPMELHQLSALIARWLGSESVAAKVDVRSDISVVQAA